jgi:hypothetical protein
MERNDDDECIGGGWGAKPLIQSVEQERDGSKTGACAACGQRLRLDENGGLPRHDLPDPDSSN